MRTSFRAQLLHVLAGFLTPCNETETDTEFDGVAHDEEDEALRECDADYVCCEEGALGFWVEEGVCYVGG